jgi:hypothetical protein
LEDHHTKNDANKNGYNKVYHDVVMLDGLIPL